MPERPDASRSVTSGHSTRSFTIESCGGIAPTQADGRTADDRPYYFRARRGRWTLEVGPAGVPTDYLEWPHTTGRWEQWVVAAGEDETHGAMERDAVEAILRRHLPWPPLNACHAHGVYHGNDDWDASCCMCDDNPCGSVTPDAQARHDEVQAARDQRPEAARARGELDEAPF